MGAGNEDGETRQTCPRKREVLSEGKRDKGWRRETRETQKEEGRGKNNGEQEREGWKEQKNRGKTKRWTGRRGGNGKREGENLAWAERAAAGGASSPSLMAVK